MAESVESKVIRSIKASEELYHRLVLVVGKVGSGKTSVLQNLSKRFHSEMININLLLSKELLELTQMQRQLRLPEIMAESVKVDTDTVFLDNIELLFDAGLKLDPLRLLEGLSRNRTVIASWNGSFHKGSLSYAEHGHNEYRNYELREILVVSMNGEATVDLQ